VRKFSPRAAIAAVIAIRTSFNNLPTAGFSSFGSDFILSLHSETLPLRPRNFTRTVSRTPSSGADAIWARASSHNCSSGCMNVEAFSEPTVGHAISADGGVQALDPEHAEVAFACLSIPIGPILAFHRRVFGVTEKFGATTTITFRFS